MKEYKKLELIIALLYATLVLLATTYIFKSELLFWSKIIYVVFLAIGTYYVGKFLRMKKKEAKSNEKLN